MSSYISCYNQETRELEHYKVPYDVSVYIQQLECEIKYSTGGVIVRKKEPMSYTEMIEKGYTLSDDGFWILPSEG